MHNNEERKPEACARARAIKREKGTSWLAEKKKKREKHAQGKCRCFDRSSAYTPSLVASTCVRFDRVIHDPLFVSRPTLRSGVQACRCSRIGQRRAREKERAKRKEGEEKGKRKFFVSPRFRIDRIRGIIYNRPRFALLDYH